MVLESGLACLKNETGILSGFKDLTRIERMVF